MRRHRFVYPSVLVSALLLLLTAAHGAPVTFVFTSDLHFGIHRSYFRGAANVEAKEVNAALAAAINRVPATRFPADAGLRAGEPVGPVDFVMVTGDIANRQELLPLRIQPAAASWAQFETYFAQRLALTDAAGAATPLLLVPGNHDASNAIGAPVPMVPATDPTAMVAIYNRMMRPAVPAANSDYQYTRDVVRYTREFGGVLIVGCTIWPDSATRSWLDGVLRSAPATQPVLLFCHDQPDIEAKHLRNPNGDHGINATDKFENLVADALHEGTLADAPTTFEQRELARFLRRHPNIVGYFHGNANWNEFYTWKGPDRELALATFRADSPIKGRQSGKDEALLSFQVVTYDLSRGKLTARECRWNATPAAEGPLQWREMTTLDLQVKSRDGRQEAR